MEKRKYIQPEMGTIVLPQSPLMEFQGSPGESLNPPGAPKRRVEEVY